MKIALISPRGNILSKNPEFKKFWEGSKEVQFYKRFWSGVCPGLLVVAALTPKKYKIDFIDENVEEIDFDKGYDLVALTGMTQQAVRAYEIAGEFRKRKTTVVMGGIHATVLPEEAKKHCDSVFVGEAENTWPRFIKDLERNKIEPFYISQGPVDLTKSPIPRYDLLKPEKYHIIWLQTTRGCPFDCEFCTCTKIFGRKFRFKPIKQVIQEVKYIKSIAKENWIGFGDDNMFVNRKYSLEILKKIVPLKIRWMTQTDISVARDNRLLTLLRESGCYILFVGFESLSKQNLRLVDKVGFKIKNLDNYRKYIKKVQSRGIGVMGAFILGFDYDKRDVFKKTIDFIVETNLYAAQVSCLTPFPGTRMRKNLEEQNRVLSNKWDSYTFWDVNFTPNKMSVEQLQHGLLTVYKGIYNKKVFLVKDRYFKNIYSNLARVNT